MSTRNGAAITWTSYNLPAALSASGYTASFNYAPDRSRWRQIATYTGSTDTTIYVAGLVEKLTTSVRVHWKHRIAVPSGEVQVVRRSDGTNDVFYITTDHLGSTDTVTDAAANVLARESFGVWGARRAANWQGSPSPGEWQQIANTTRRGYTGHEQLDNLLLVHMNGRVYDPAIGRFMSADPYVNGVNATQAWNRYGYVGNNPLAYTDPSGYFQRGDSLASLVKAIDPRHFGQQPDQTIEEVIWEYSSYPKAVGDRHQAGGGGGGGGGGSGSGGTKPSNGKPPCTFDDPGVGESEFVHNVGTVTDGAESTKSFMPLVGAPKVSIPSVPWPQAMSFLANLGGQALGVVGHVGQAASAATVVLELANNDYYGAAFAAVDVAVYSVLGKVAATGPETGFLSTAAAVAVGVAYCEAGGAGGIATGICIAVSN